MNTEIFNVFVTSSQTPPSAWSYVVSALYIVAFGMFIYGLMGLTGPKTAVRGNWIAGIGMVLAIAATILNVPVRNGQLGGPEAPGTRPVPER